mgnify:CR=1 FL=1
MSVLDVVFKKDIDAGVRTCRATKGAILLDVRLREEYNFSHIEGARCLPLEQLEKAPSAMPDKSRAIFVYCYKGSRSAKAAKILTKMGYERVTDIGGLKNYSGKLVKGK